MNPTVERKTEFRNGVLRLSFITLSLLFQMAWIYVQFEHLRNRYPIIPAAVTALALISVMGIYGKHMNSALKIPWIMLISAFPFFGVSLYLMIGMSGSTRKMKRRYSEIDACILPYLSGDEAAFAALEKKERKAANQFRYLREQAGYPVYQNTDLRYYRTAAEAFEAQLEEIAKAKRFVLLEYHAIEQKKAFHRLLEVLKERAAKGVEVRIFYDDLGSIGFIDTDFIQRMKADGISCRVFNPVVPLLSFFMNYRDHRKITVIDGRVAFTGGYNLADEYFNLTHPYGHWLDTGIRMEGDAVRTMTAIVLQNWNAIRGDDADEHDWNSFFAEYHYEAKQKGWCQPYADTPLDDEPTGENVYMNLLNGAERYIWFTSPYLILTDEMTRAFSLAAKRGVDVRIVTPGIPDKRLVYRTTRSYYGALVRNGVRIYEYSPGFCHAKQCVADDRIAVCGTINLDFRSLYHHFENGVLMYDYPMIHEMRDHFLSIFESCREVTEQYRCGRSHPRRAEHCLLRFISPLL